MSSVRQLRVRRSILDLQKDYEDNNKKPLEDLIRAWKGITELPADDPRSFFVLGGYHGEPFRGAGWGSAAYWGGYCNHGNVLFPTWHRVYLLEVENALRSIPGCESVTMPYWDETSADSLAHGIPAILTQERFVLDGGSIPNPLQSFVLTRNIKDHIGGDNPDYGKPKGYRTVRYPLSGLVGPVDIAKTLAHNALYPDYATNVQLLNQNIVAWLTSAIVVHGSPIQTTGKYRDCLAAPNYTVFSNTVSAAEWNDNLPPASAQVVSLESPHNSIHLAVGGCDVPNYDRSPIEGANGDMGENDTAGLDPIFFFHHCFVDRMFWLWQQRHAATERREIIPQYPGTNSVDGQNQTPGTAPNSWLTLDSPLDPFVRVEDGRRSSYTSRDCVHVEDQLGYTYAPGSMEQAVEVAATLHPAQPIRKVRVSGINRGAIRGSFMISAYAVIDGKRYHLGTEAVLSRWHVSGCMNCQAHLEAKAHIGMPGLRAESLQEAHIEVEVRTRDGLLLDHPPPLRMADAGVIAARKPFRVELI